MADMNENFKTITDTSLYPFPKGCKSRIIHDTTGTGRAFLHDTAVTFYKDELFVSWYSCPAGEIQGDSSIVGRASVDNGKNWSELFTIVSSATNSSAKHFVPVSFINHEDGLFAIVSKMTAHDRPFAVELYKFDEKERAWFAVKEIFSLEDDLSLIVNGNAVLAKNGNFVCGGRLACGANKYPDIPCAIISEGNDITKWKTVALSNSPVGNCPETTIAITADGTLIAVTRNPEGMLTQISRDDGLSWAKIDLPLPATPVKLYAYTLNSGKTLICFNGINPDGERNRLCLATLDGLEVDKIYTVAYGKTDLGDIYHYPSLVEKEGVLYITCTLGAHPRHALLITLPVSSL